MGYLGHDESLNPQPLSTLPMISMSTIGYPRYPQDNPSSRQIKTGHPANILASVAAG